MDPAMSSRSSSRSSSFSLCHMMDSAYARVIFCETHDSYSLDSDVECIYQLSDSVVPHPEDYIGLFRVGWQDPDECIASIPCSSAACSASVTGDCFKVVFKAEDLPKDDVEYYQFLYLTGDDNICGASTPFRFHSVHEDENVVVLSAEHDFLEVKSSSSLLHNRLAEAQKCVAFLEKEKKELEDRIDKIKKESHEGKERLEKIKTSEREELEMKFIACLTSIVEGSKILPPLPNCSEKLEGQIYGLKVMMEHLSKENVALKTSSALLKSDLNKVQGRFDKFKESLAAVQNTTLTDSVKESVHLLSKENAELKEERYSLQKALNDTKDLFRASEECKSLFRQELENMKKSKDEMSASMEDLKLLNSLLKKQLANNENAIKEMEKVWRELEEVKSNFDSEKESWNKQRNELETQVCDLTVRLQEAAELYKKQYLEIRTLKKQLKTHEPSKRKFSIDGAVGPVEDRTRCSSCDSIQLLEGIQTPSFMTQSLTSLSESYKGESILKAESEQNEAVPTSRPANLSPNYLAQSACFPQPEVSKASAPAEEEFGSSGIRTSATKSYPAPFALHEFLTTDGPNRPTSNTRSSGSGVLGFFSEDTNLKDKSHIEYVANVNAAASQELYNLNRLDPETFDLPCPMCDEMITVYAHNTTVMDEHLLKVHNQQLCPVCGRMFDKGLPSNYFKYHVEHHFSSTHSPQ